MRHHHQDLHLSFCNSELYKTEGSGAGMNCYYHGYVCSTDYTYDWADVAAWL